MGGVHFGTFQPPFQSSHFARNPLRGSPGLEKGLPTLLEAFAAARSYCPAARLVCVGEGPLRQALQETAAKHGLSGAVDFRGWVPRDALATLYARARVCVVPSLAEMAPLVPLEALSFGTPLIVTDLKGGREYFDDRATWIMPPGDVQALAMALRAAVTEDTVAYLARRVASKRLSETWPWSAHVAGTMKVHFQALGHAPLAHLPGDPLFGKPPAVPIDETTIGSAGPLPHVILGGKEKPWDD